MVSWTSIIKLKVLEDAYGRRITLEMVKFTRANTRTVSCVATADTFGRVATTTLECGRMGKCTEEASLCFQMARSKMECMRIISLLANEIPL